MPEMDWRCIDALAQGRRTIRQLNTALEARDREIVRLRQLLHDLCQDYHIPTTRVAGLLAPPTAPH